MHLIKKHIHFHKSYDAIVEGKLPAVPLTINWPIGRKPGSIIERYCTTEGKPARTDITVISHNTRPIVDKSPIIDSTLLSVVTIWLMGIVRRTSLTCNACYTQGALIRFGVHVSQLGYPLAGDDLYGGPFRLYPAPSTTRSAR